jgi:hypothetical protein
MKKITRQIHPFHLVDPSPWPLLGAFSAMGATSGGVMYMHAYKSGGYLLALGLFGIVLVMAVWWRDIIREATFEGQHTHAVQQGLRWGMALFIVSEIMFFLPFFGHFFGLVVLQLLKLVLFGHQKVLHLLTVSKFLY